MKPKKDNQCCEECADVDFEKTWPAHTATQFCASSNCPCHQKDNQNISQGNCEQCKNLPEGEVIKGHDHRIQKDNRELWEKEFEEKFIANDILDCIPEENWEEMKGEVFNFIRNLLTSQRQSLLEEVEKDWEKKLEEKILSIFRIWWATSGRPQAIIKERGKLGPTLIYEKEFVEEIKNLIYSLLCSQKSQLVEEVEKMKRIKESRFVVKTIRENANTWREGFNQAIEDILELLRSKR